MFTQKDYEDFVYSLKSIGSPKLADFYNRSNPSNYKSLGISVPRLRGMAKEVAKGDFRGFLSCKSGEYVDEYMVKAMVMAAAKMPIEEKLLYVKKFVPYIESWAVCDTLCNDFKDARKNRERVWEFLKEYYNSDKEFELRFLSVMLLWHFTTDEYTDESLKILASIHHTGYYAKMGVAWGISQFFIYQRDKTMPLIESMTLDPWIQNKAIQKIRESFRASKDDKEYLLNFKAKK